MRRTLIIAGAAVIGLLLLAVLAYFLFFRSSAPGITAGTGQNPFGEGANVAPGAGATSTDSGATPTEVAPHLVRITTGPVAYGVAAMSIPQQRLLISGSGTTTSTSTYKIYETDVRYAERESGNVFSYDFTDKTLTRISNKTLPGIQEASWAADGTTAFLRFLTTQDNGNEVIDTYALPVGKDDGGYFLETDLGQVVITGTSTVVTLLPSTTGTIATAARVDGAAPKTVFSSPLSSLRLYAAGKGYAAATKASASADGYGFMVSSAGAFTRVLGPLSGLTLLPSPSEKSVLFSYDSGNTVVAGVLDVATRTVTTLPIAALPDKCVWAADESAIYCGVPRTMSGTWPDDWYQGVTSFSDRIWKIDLAARNADLIVDPVAVANVAMDAVSLAIDPRSDALFFTNKKDGSLWAYDL